MVDKPFTPNEALISWCDNGDRPYYMNNKLSDYKEFHDSLEAQMILSSLEYEWHVSKLNETHRLLLDRTDWESKE